MPLCWLLASLLNVQSMGMIIFHCGGYAIFWVLVLCLLLLVRDCLVTRARSVLPWPILDCPHASLLVARVVVKRSVHGHDYFSLWRVCNFLGFGALSAAPRS